jgi:hypothetical protein
MTIAPAAAVPPARTAAAYEANSAQLGWRLFPEQRAVALNRSSRSIRLGHPCRLHLHWLS